ncbi:MAG TPA: hypothetical protein DCG75_10960 [Bacteroidales bacterium]|nr:hypothetical protein [Bacteroidales bacterium]
MEFSSHIYDRNTIKGDNSFKVFLLTILLLVLGYFLIDISKITGLLIILLSISILYFFHWNKKEPEGKYIGEIKLTKDTFVLNNETFETKDIDEVKIELEYPKGKKMWNRIGYNVCSGTRNKLEILVNGQKKKCNFLLLSDKHLRDIVHVIEELYTKGIFVKEFYLGDRTYLLKKLSLEEIKKFKKKIWI